MSSPPEDSLAEKYSGIFHETTWGRVAGFNSLCVLFSPYFCLCCKWNNFERYANSDHQLSPRAMTLVAGLDQRNQAGHGGTWHALGYLISLSLLLKINLVLALFFTPKHLFFDFNFCAICIIWVHLTSREEFYYKWNPREGMWWASKGAWAGNWKDFIIFSLPLPLPLLYICISVLSTLHYYFYL